MHTFNVSDKVEPKRLFTILTSEFRIRTYTVRICKKVQDKFCRLARVFERYRRQTAEYRSNRMTFKGHSRSPHNSLETIPGHINF